MWLGWQGRLDEMARLVEKWTAALPESRLWQIAKFLERAFLGAAEEALALAGPLDQYVRQVGGQSGLYMAEGYAMAGETASALEMLEVAVDQGFINYPFLAKYDDFLEPVRHDPRGQALLARVRREWETFDA